MPTITVVEVEAVLKARDELTAILKNVSTQSKETATSTASLTGVVEGLNGVIGRYASAAVALAAIKATFDYGMSIRNLSLETNVGIERMQQMNIVSHDLGASQGELANAVYQLSRRIAGGDASASSALEALGLRVADLKKLSPDQLFMTIAAAAGEVQDGLRKADFSADLFGARLGRVVIPLLNKDLPDAMRRAGESGQVMSEQQVQFLAQGEESFDRWMRQGKGAIGAILDGYAWLATRGAYAITGNTQYVQDAIDASARLRQVTVELSDAEQDLANRRVIQNVVNAEREKMETALTFDQQLAVKTLTELNAITADHLKAIGVTIEQYKAWQEEQRANIELTKAWGAAKIAEADADNEGLKRAIAVAEATHELNVHVIEDTVQSAVEKTAKLTAEDQRYADERLKIASASARSIRDLEDQTAQAILNRQASLVDQEIKMLEAAARVKATTHEQLAQTLLNIQVRYASAHFLAERKALEAEEALEIARATREAATAEEAARKKIAIETDYRDRLKALTIGAMTALFTQEEALQKAHQDRMRSLGFDPQMAPTEGSPYLTPGARVAQGAHEDVVRSLEGAKQQARDLGQGDEVQRLQQMIEEENNAFAREIENLNRGLTAAGQTASVAAGGLQTAAISAFSAGAAVDTMSQATGKAAEALSGVHRQSMGGTLRGVSATELTRATYASLGLSALFNPHSPAAEADDARRAAALAAGPSWRTGSTTVHVEPHFSGPMIGSDPTSLAMLYDHIEKAVMSALSQRLTMPNH